MNLVTPLDGEVRLLLGRLRGRTNDKGMRTTLERMTGVLES